jgi:hypothetical protein
MWRPDDFLALPEDVTAFAWSAPMRDLAQTIGISDVGLKKLLRAQGIVTPPQGHWNRVHAGRKVPAPPSPRPRGPGERGRISLDRRFREHVPEATSMPIGGPFASALVPEDLDELKARELKALPRVAAPRDLSRPHVGLLRVLKRDEQRREKFVASDWLWDRPLFDGPLTQRELRIADGLLKALARRGHSGEVQEDRRELTIRVSVGDTGVALAFEIIGSHRTEMIAGNRVPAHDLPVSTPLRLGFKRLRRSGEHASWCDQPGKRLEKCVAEIAAEVIVAGEAAFRRSLVEAAEAEAEHARWLEESRRRKLAELAGKRIADLKQSGDLLRKAEEIRALVAQVKHAVEQGSELVSAEQLARWEIWALSQADVLDPLRSGQVLTHLYVPAIDDAKSNQ